MQNDTVIGIALVALALTMLIALVAWCRRIIERIAKSNVSSAREIEKARRNE